MIVGRTGSDKKKKFKEHQISIYKLETRKVTLNNAKTAPTGITQQVIVDSVKN